MFFQCYRTNFPFLLFSPYYLFFSTPHSLSFSLLSFSGQNPPSYLLIVILQLHLVCYQPLYPYLGWFQPNCCQLHAATLIVCPKQLSLEVFWSCSLSFTALSWRTDWAQWAGEGWYLNHLENHNLTRVEACLNLF